MRIILFLILFTCCAGQLYAQYTTDKVVGEKHKDLSDSLKKLTYEHILPIWGQKVMEKGFEIPKSAGISVQYIYQQSDILITDLQVGFNNGLMYPLDEIIRFKEAVATTNGVNVRPDVWLFPFLNVYGILAKSKSTTAIDAGVWLPDETGWTEVGSIKTKAEFDATTYGFGLTPTVGVGGFFFALDANFSWSDIDKLEDPAFVFVLGPRLGKNFKLKKPGRSIAAWIGGFRVKMNTGTAGSIPAGDLFPLDEWTARVDAGYEKLETNQQKVDDWWGGLTPAEQKHPANIAKHETANRVLGVYGGVLDGASQIVSNAGDASIQYSLNKKPKDMWNFIIGSQFQLNRSWMLRAEYGFLGTRQQFIAGLQYRFDF